MPGMFSQVLRAYGNSSRRPPTLTDRLNLQFARGTSPVEKYKESGNRWITIGGSAEGSRGVQHAGGTSVQIDGSGKIVKGPGALEGRDLDEFSLKADKPKQRQRKQQQDRLFDPHPAAAPPKKTKPSKPSGPPPGVLELPDGRRIGASHLQASEITMDPKRFQYKVIGIDPKTGTTKELTEVKKFNPLFAGQILVWHDPNDDKPYVVNGHHRIDLAQRSGYEGPLSVYYIDAENPGEARALGALANIAEGRGTAIDAAKFMRERGVTPGDMADEGISLKGKVASDAADISKLSDRLFQDLTLGKMTEGRALAVSRHVPTETQDKMMDIVAKREERAGGKRIKDDVLEEIAREFAATPTRTTQKNDLFGSFTDTDSVFVERAELKKSLRRSLKAQVNAFGSGSSSAKAEVLAETGTNVLDVEGNRQRHQEAKETFWSFDQLVNRRGELSSAINEAAEELANEPKRKKQIEERLASHALLLLSEQGQNAGVNAEGGGPAKFGRARESSQIYRPQWQKGLTARLDSVFRARYQVSCLTGQLNRGLNTEPNIKYAARSEQSARPHVYFCA